MLRGVQLARSVPEYSAFPQNFSVGKGFKHREQAQYALWPTNPETFQLAGMSHDVHIELCEQVQGHQKRTA